MKLSIIALGLCSTLMAANLWAKTTLPSYEPYVIAEKTVYLSGQIPVINGEVQFPGQLGSSVSIEEGIKAAELAAGNVLMQLGKAAGSFDQVKSCAKVSVFINSSPDFKNHKDISGAASETIIAALGDKGRHARTTLGVSSLPMGAAVEVEAICILY